MRKEWVTLNSREQVRLIVLNEVLQGNLTRKEAADALQLSPRQLRRLLATYRHDGAQALAHGNRGRPPSNRLPDEIRTRVLDLAAGRFQGANDCHLTELLAREEGIVVSRPTLRRLLRQAGIKSPQKRRPPKHRQRRERRPRRGMLVLIDGSLHNWLEDRGPALTLLGSLDDATGEVLAAFFQPHEDARGYFRLMHQIVTRHGLPEAVYVDRHAIFVHITNAALSIDEQLQGARGRPTQFAKLLQRLAVAILYARSPQAKGRIERLWRTFQDRLVMELRLAGASTLEQANAVLADFLPRYNRQFAVPPADPESAFRPAPPDLDDLFTLRWPCTVALDHTVRCNGLHLQILPAPGERGYARCRVELYEHLDGHLSLHHGERSLPFRPAPPDASTMRFKAKTRPPALPQQATKPAADARTPHKPPKDHPWRLMPVVPMTKRTFSLTT